MIGRTPNFMRQPAQHNNIAIIHSRGTLDWAIAPFNLALAGCAMGKEVTIFFTAYGLLCLKKDLSALSVTMVGNPAMPAKLPFGPAWLRRVDFNQYLPQVVWQMPGANALATYLMKETMRQKNLPTIEALRTQAVEMGVRLVACTMTMETFGFDRADFIEGIDFGGAATFYGAAEGGQAVFI